MTNDNASTSSGRRTYFLICIGIATFTFILWTNMSDTSGDQSLRYFSQDILHNNLTDAIIKGDDVLWDSFSRSEKIKGLLATKCKDLGYRGTFSSQTQVYNSITKDQRYHILVDEEDRTLYCRVPKVGTSNWHRVFVFLTGKMEENGLQDIPYTRIYSYYRDNKHYIKYINSYYDKQAIFQLENYFRFVFIRDPFERLVSAYRHMIEKHKWYHVINAVRKYLTKYRPEQATDRKNTLKGETSKGNSAGNLKKQITFEEFASFVVDSQNGTEHELDEHYRPQYLLCNPCVINFDFIGKYSTISEDADFVLHKMGVSDRVTFPARNLSYAHTKTNAVMRSYYKTVPYLTLWKIYRLYYADYLLFDLPPPKF